MRAPASASDTPTIWRVASVVLGICAVLLALTALIAQLWLFLVVAAAMGFGAFKAWSFAPPPPAAPEPAFVAAPTPSDVPASPASPALEREIERWVKKGFHVTNRGPTTASLYKPKRVGMWTGFAGYMFRNDQTVYLRLDDRGRVKRTKS
jgi:hypothetical protein